ncbi:iron-containing alcohol dehydrogenase [Anaeroselena agilis]|uniref:Iron-containing alcohol dehydrogenase n=1 Tax=Anaeroselena agilis TaxID=3063788 RepID=A0ABU3P1E0_9FIRM|nr:iron-containing alcohol dehydrogenase [Selenomonadales bacterium 4137-cl]
MKEIILGGQTLVTGSGSLEHLAAVPARRAVIVTGGSSMIKTGVVAKIEKLLQAQGCATLVHAGVPANPDTEAVLAGVAQMRPFAPDLVIAVGGGSALDAAKVMTLFTEYPGLDFAAALAGALPAARKAIRLVAIPSTSGTGSEVTKVAVVTFRDQNLKIGLRTPAFIPDIAILDADLTLTMPPNVVAETGMDALTHAVECYINRNIDDFTGPMAAGAAAGLLEHLPVSYRDKTIDSREKVHNFQSLAGLAFGNVGLGAAHGIAHSLGGLWNLGHGLVNAILLPHVLEYNARDPWVGDRIRRLAAACGVPDLIAAIRGLNQTLGIPASLRAAGIDEQTFTAALPELVAGSMQGATRVNPVPVTPAEMEALLRRVYA